mmetsp:Transcript_2133/g.4496  ORF Transcript_2133/g.4496 Transcript_2133/m.4496 type:complete len:121 (+) Transcript_2133:1004-1366(+)
MKRERVAISPSPERDSSVSSGVPWSLEKIKNALTAVGVSPEGQQEIFRSVCKKMTLGLSLFLCAVSSRERGQAAEVIQRVWRGKAVCLRLSREKQVGQQDNFSHSLPSCLVAGEKKATSI